MIISPNWVNSWGTWIESAWFNIWVVQMTWCKNSSSGCGHGRNCVCTQNTEQVPSEITVQHYSVRPFNR